MKKRMIQLLEEIAAEDQFDEAKYEEYWLLLSKIPGAHGPFGAAADELTDYYSHWQACDRSVPPNDLEVAEIRENLRLLVKGIRANITEFRSFKDLRKRLEGAKSPNPKTS